MQALLAIMALAAVVSSFPEAPRLTAGDWVLLCLSLPVVATLNFYLGFPLRACVAAVSSGLLQIAGFGVMLQGTELLWGEHLVQVDAPCSGIKLLWFSCYVAAALASAYRLRAFGAALLVAGSIPAALIGNVMRVTALFFLETGTLGIARDSAMAEWVHQATGVSAFLAIAVLVALVAQRLQRRCALSPPPAEGESRARRYVPGGLLEKSVWGGLFAISLVAGLLPFVPMTSVSVSKVLPFSGWPKSFEGRALKPIQQTEEATRFTAGFPGQVAVFDSDGRSIILRWVMHETRQVHPSADCYRALGYDIKWLPAFIGKQSERWNCFEARRNGCRLFVRECIFDSDFKGICSDVSSWYWAAVSHKTSPPWWIVTVVERR